MDALIGEIRQTLKAGSYTLALQGTLACVDVCAALASDDGRTSRAHFKTWFGSHIPSSYQRLSADDAYQLRCGMLHQGRAVGHQYSAIVFTLPDNSGNTFHDNIIDDALNLDLITFCTEVLRAAETWWWAHREAEPVVTNAANLVRVRPHGLAPYIVGVPLLA